MRRFGAAAIFVSSLLASSPNPAHAWAASGQQNGTSASGAPVGNPKPDSPAPVSGTPSFASLPANTAAANLANAAQTVGTPLPASSVSSSISVDAVLLPYSIAKHSFGKEVAHNYAVVSMTISNRDPKQGLILQSVLLDYSHWLFNGSFSALSRSGLVSMQPWQQQNTESQVGSAEVRTVRNELQDAQRWTARNWTIRSAVAIGSVAAGLSFLSTASYFSNGLSVYGSAFVPALGVLWPDNTQSQINLISDIGFRTNRVVPANSSDVVIAFFPLDRFLTPALKKIYFKAPAEFFNPSELLFDKKGSSEILGSLEKTGFIPVPQDKTMANVVATAVQEYEAAVEAEKRSGSSVTDPCATAPLPPQLKDPNDCLVVSLLDRVSLNNIRLVVGGAMTVDTASVPATISSISITNDTQSVTWSSGAKIAVTLTGTFLSGANVAISGTDSTGQPLPTTDFGTPTVDTTASDAILPLIITLGANIPSGSKLAFTVTKKAKDGSTTTSAPFNYNVNFSSTAPTVTGATVTNDTQAATWNSGSKVSATLTGTNLSAPIVNVFVTGTNNAKTALPSGDFSAITTGSGTATSLSVKFTLGANIPPGSTLSFTVKTTAADGTGASSTAYSYTVPAFQ